MAVRVNNAIKAILEKRKMTGRELAAGMKITPAHVSLLLSGKRQWSLEQIENAAKALGVPDEALLGRNGDRPMPNRVCVTLPDEAMRKLTRHAATDYGIKTVENLVLSIVSQWLRAKGEP